MYTESFWVSNFSFIYLSILQPLFVLGGTLQGNWVRTCSIMDQDTGVNSNNYSVKLEGDSEFFSLGNVRRSASRMSVGYSVGELFFSSQEFIQVKSYDTRIPS